MMVTLRLYRQHDLDLIALYRHPNFSLPAAMKTALCAYVRDESFFIKQPMPYAIGNEKISKIIQMHIQLSNTSDKDVIDWIKNIKEGYRNSVLKNIIRAYMLGGTIYPYALNQDISIAKTNKISQLLEENVSEIIEIKGRGYTKSQNNTLNKSSKKPLSNEKIEDSELANKILKGDSGKKPTDKIFVENIEKEVDTKKLEEITKPEPKQADTSPKDVSLLDDMLDDIDAMMDGL